MNEMPLVSVIITAYNMEQYIEKCVRSAMDQSYCNIEILVINDGSTDKTATICEKLRDQDGKIRLINKENGGLSDARNCGLDNVCGEYIAFLDADDMYHPRFIERLIDALEYDDAEIAQCDFFSIHDQEQHFFDMTGEKEVMSGEEAVIKCYEGYYTNYNSPWNKIYKSHLFKNIRFPLGRWRDDEFTIWRVFLEAKRVVYCHEFLYGYLNRGDSNTVLHNKKMHTDGVDAFCERAVFLQKKGYIKEAVIAYNQALYEVKCAIQLSKKNTNETEALNDRLEEINKCIADLHYGFDLPLEKIKEDSSVAVFGAGRMGTDLYNQLKSGVKRIRDVIMVDTYHLRNNNDVKSIDYLLNPRIDHIVIAVSDDKMRMQMRNIVRKMGIDESKII